VTVKIKRKTKKHLRTEEAFIFLAKEQLRDLGARENDVYLENM
jgi:hypothetical protein